MLKTEKFTALAPCGMTCKQGARLLNNHIFRVLDSNSPFIIHVHLSWEYNNDYGQFIGENLMHVVLRRKFSKPRFGPNF